jgi:hypothetical protein
MFTIRVIRQRLSSNTQYQYERIGQTDLGDEMEGFYNPRFWPFLNHKP